MRALVAKAGQDPKSRFLEATMAYVARHGVGELTLRQLAPVLGTSHRMLVYHFGSKEDLLVEVVREVERGQREFVSELMADSNLDVGEQIRRTWRRFADPSMWPSERLFFEVYGAALQGRPHARPFLDDVVEAWLKPLTRAAMRHGLNASDARGEARLALAVTRGLLLDLLATRNRKEVDRAMERFILGYESRISALGKKSRSPRQSS